MILDACRLCFSYGSLSVLHELDIIIRPGITAIVGPNAAGKSTLLRCLCGLLRPAAGQVRLDGKDIHSLRREELAHAISYLPQDISGRAALTVFETVLLGRMHQLRWHVRDEDAHFVQNLLEDFGLAGLGDRSVTDLSGGQAQLVAIAQALAREPAVLLLDEPNASLDLQHQFDLCDRIVSLTRSRGLCTAISVHDINMAARIADTVCVLEAGHIRCQGTPESVLTEAIIASVYNVSASVTRHADGRPRIMPLGVIRRTEGAASFARRGPKAQ